ncbi:MAG: hypothetical protein HIU91_11210 [Acidobacteria bacterium]|nr:hypothetical protein [Acidobacteriota bacterium]
MRKAFVASYLPEFRRDIREVVAWSEERFARRAADRYGVLIRQALRDVLEEPTRPGATARPGLAPHAWVCYLVFSRERVAGERVAGERVKAPRLPERTDEPVQIGEAFT